MSANFSTMLRTARRAGALLLLALLSTLASGLAEAQSSSVSDFYPELNLVGNSGFLVNQRGYTSGTTLAAGTYGHDRWKAGSGGAVYTFTQAYPVTAVTITAGTLVQVVEGTLILGANYGLSCGGTAQCRFTYANSSNAVVTTAYTSNYVNVLDAAAQNNLTFECGVDGGSGSVTLGKVELVAGTAPTLGNHGQYVARTLPAVLARAQRYYNVVPLIGRVAITDGGSFGVPLQFPTMLIAPAPTIRSSSTCSQQAGYPSVSNAGTDAATLNLAAAATGGCSYNVTVGLSADL